MPINKHKIFLIPLTKDGMDANSKVLREIDDFLSQENNLYVNHSITTLSKSETASITGSKNPDYDPAFFHFRNVDTFCVLSLVYTDLRGTAEDLSKLSEKSKKVVKRSVEGGIKIPRPEIQVGPKKRVEQN